MPNEVISTCPICAHDLSVSRLHCAHCGTTLDGDFSVGRFGRLSREQLALLESFLRSRGNLRDMERELGISYPTVRNRVDALVRALGLADGEGTTTTDELEHGTSKASLSEAEVAELRREVLEQVSSGELDPIDAALRIRNLGQGR